jgi:hypothetical protein
MKNTVRNGQKGIVTETWEVVGNTVKYPNRYIRPPGQVNKYVKLFF